MKVRGLPLDPGVTALFERVRIAATDDAEASREQGKDFPFAASALPAQQGAAGGEGMVMVAAPGGEQHALHEPVGYGFLAITLYLNGHRSASRFLGLHYSATITGRNTTRNCVIDAKQTNSQS